MRKNSAHKRDSTAETSFVWLSTSIVASHFSLNKFAHRRTAWVSFDTFFFTSSRWQQNLWAPSATSDMSWSQQCQRNVRDISHSTWLWLTYYRAQYPVAICAPMGRRAPSLRHIRWDPIWTCDPAIRARARCWSWEFDLSDSTGKGRKKGKIVEKWDRI